MLEFNLSSALAKAMKIQTKAPAYVNSSHFRWFAHIVTVKRKRCLIAMEWRSRYAIVFCNLSARELSDFPTLFRDRLWREACAICQIDHPLSEVEIERIAALSDLISEHQVYQQGFDRSVTGHLNYVSEVLKDPSTELPEDDSEEFRFGLYVNQLPRRCGKPEEVFFPVDEFRQFWTGLISSVESMQRTTAPSNVVHVDFRQATNKSKDRR